jgi:hypothetical protein
VPRAALRLELVAVAGSARFCSHVVRRTGNAIGPKDSETA